MHRSIWMLTLLLATFSPAAFAYLDPSTGSMLISAIVGLVASLALAIKTYWYQSIGFLRRLFGRHKIQQQMTDVVQQRKTESSPESERDSRL